MTTKTTSGGSSRTCPGCTTVSSNSSDKYCRKCGWRLQLLCSYCSAPVPIEDRFCPNCGRRRFYFLELWRNRALLECSMGARACVVLGVASAFGLLYLFVKKRIAYWCCPLQHKTVNEMWDFILECRVFYSLHRLLFELYQLLNIVGLSNCLTVPFTFKFIKFCLTFLRYYTLYHVHTSLVVSDISRNICLSVKN